MRAKLLSWWQFIKIHRITVQLILIFLVIAIILILIGYLFDWTGFNTYSITWLPKINKGVSLPVSSVEEQIPYKTLWDWLQLLGVLAIPVVVVWFTYTLQQRDKRLENLQRERDKELADERAKLERKAAERRAQAEQKAAKKRAQTERKIALDNQQEAALQAYFDRMSELLLDYHLLEAQRGSEICTIARLRTTSAIRGLDPRRKGYVLRFVYGAGLIKIDDPIIDLNSAKFSDVNLRVTKLIGVSIIGANFWKAIFSGAELNGDFRWTTFDEADLRWASLGGDFQETSFKKAKLYKASLGGDFRKTNFNKADLRHASLNGADLRHASFINANLSEVTLVQTNLREADLTGADLSGVDLSYVHLEGASLKGATNVNIQQSNEAAYFLQETIMPDGSIHP